MTINFRIIAKLCFLVVIIGFCMPMACDANGFKIASGDVASNELKMALYTLFITAIIGFLIGIILLINKNIPVIVDWLVMITCILCGTIPFFKNLGDYGDSYQSGIYIIMVGYGLILVTQLASLAQKSLIIKTKNTEINTNDTKINNISTFISNKKRILLISGIIGLVLILLDILYYLNVLRLGFFRMFFNVPFMSGLIAMILCFVCYSKNIKILPLISGILFSVLLIYKIFNIIKYFYFNIHLFFDLLFIIPAILCFLIFAKNKNKIV
jgi:hypothetical protein